MELNIREGVYMNKSKFLFSSCLVCGLALTINVTTAHAANENPNNSNQQQTEIVNKNVNNTSKETVVSNNKQSSSTKDSVSTTNKVNNTDQNVEGNTKTNSNNVANNTKVSNSSNDYQENKQNKIANDNSNSNEININKSSTINSSNSNNINANESNTNKADVVDSNPDKNSVKNNNVSNDVADKQKATINNTETTNETNKSSNKLNDNNINTKVFNSSKTNKVNQTKTVTPKVTANQLTRRLYASSYNATQVANATYIWNFFTSRGWTPNATAGLLGNVVSESSIYPDIWEGGYGPGYGLVQWTPASNLINWCNARGLNYKTLYAQCSRIDYEMKNGLQFYPSGTSSMTAYQYMHSTASAYTLGMIFLANYERPANGNQPSRGNQSQYWYNYFGGKSGGGSSTGGGSTSNIPSSGTYKFAYNTNIRTSPSTNGAVIGQYAAGESVNYYKTVNADGYTWLVYTAASGATHYVAATGGTATASTGGGIHITPASGTYTFTTDTNVRTAPSLNGQIIARYSAGQSVNYFGKVNADGYTWLAYKAGSGATHYVAVVNGGSSTNVPSSGTYTFTTATNIRTTPSVNGQIIGSYNAGQSVNYYGTVNADGYTWLKYTAASGATHYVAVVR